MLPEFPSQEIARAFDVPDPEARRGLLSLRRLILGNVPAGCRAEEVLRWGQPSYRLAGQRFGTAVRIGLHKQARFALFVHCQSRVMSDYTAAFPGKDRTDGSRAILFSRTADIDGMRHGWFIRRALTGQAP